MRPARRDPELRAAAARRRPSEGGRHLDDRDSDPGVTRCEVGDEPESLMCRRGLLGRRPRSRRILTSCFVEGLESPECRPAEKRRIESKEGVLGRCPYERDDALLDAVQQGILLCLVEAVYLVEEQDRPDVPRRRGSSWRLPAPRGRPSPRRRRPKARGSGAWCALQRGVRRTSCPSRAVRRRPQRTAGPPRRASARARQVQEVALADHVVEPGRAHPCGKGRAPRQLLLDGRVEQAARLTGLSTLGASTGSGRSSRWAHRPPTVTEEGINVKADGGISRAAAPSADM